MFGREMKNGFELMEGSSYRGLSYRELTVFYFGDHYINSHNLFSSLCIDIVDRNLMLVTLGS